MPLSMLGVAVRLGLNLVTRPLGGLHIGDLFDTVRVAMRTLGHVVLAPIAFIMIVLGGVVFSLVVIYSKLMRL